MHCALRQLPCQAALVRRLTEQMRLGSGRSGSQTRKAQRSTVFETVALASGLALPKAAMQVAKAFETNAGFEPATL